MRATCGAGECCELAAGLRCRNRMLPASSRSGLRLTTLTGGKTMDEETRIVITQEIFDRLSADQQAVLRACLAAEEAAK